MRRVVVAQSAVEIAALRPLWRRLESTPGATLFQSYHWNLHAARIFTDEAPFVIAVEDDRGAAILPTALTPGRDCLTLIGDVMFDYRDALTAGDADSLQHAWRELACLALPLRFDFLRGEAARARWSDVPTRRITAAPAVRRCDLTSDQFAAAHSRLARQIRRLQRADCVLRCYDGSATGLLRHIYFSKASQLAGDRNNYFADPRRGAFVCTVAAEQPGACQIFTIECGSTAVAALVTFLDGHVRRFYTIYIDRAWAVFSPGTALVYNVTVSSLAEGLDCDYLTGEQPHKLRLASHRVPLLRVEASAEAVARVAAPDHSVRAVT
jgi:CelD/BcsL family acetyltransferase involved in cellulose biosynthesis